jgi:phenylacetate-coenzyme A ligase PaaK-like adenylate-forming protein
MLENKIFTISSSEEFAALALEIFQLQYNNVKVYRDFCDLLKITPASVKTIRDIPFLPIEFFKQQPVISSEKTSEITFTSSGTTGSIPGKHHIADLELYKRSFSLAFTKFYGNPQEFVILALLPSYLEQEGSSLVFMVDRLIKKSNDPRSGFYLNDSESLIEILHLLENQNKKVLLLGVSYALLDLIENQSFRLKNTLVMETGGMKGRRKEMIKDELHEILKKGFGVSRIHSEYGMTELLSQAYSRGEGVYMCPPWMQILIRDPKDPLTLFEGKTGGINVIDLANIHSCSFIATQDLGKVNADGSFEILGRFDTSDIRGCNLLVL